MHLLIFLDPDHKIYDSTDVDTIVSAKLPNPDTEPLLYETITTCMLHGLCGDDDSDASCMVNGKCNKNYPKAFQDQTHMAENGYPIYARPNDNCTAQKRRHVFDNRYIVPFNPHLTAK